MTTTQSTARNGNQSRSESRGNPPAHEIRMGRIKATIWENSTEVGIRHNVTLSRLYREGDAWRDSTSFGRDDLPLVAKVADLAHSWIFEHGSANNGAS